jgi:23S rRNA pseudouridine955/2504/2580 synthase
MLRKGRVLVDGIPAGAGYRIKAGQRIEIQNISVKDGMDEIIPPDRRQPAPKAGCINTAPSLDILYEGESLLILNKPSGIAVHGRGSLEELVLPYLGRSLPSSASFRPGPLHRLDKPTSGVIVFSKSLEGAQRFSSLLRQRLIYKSYLAIVDGEIKKNETWEDVLIRDRDARKTSVLQEPRKNTTAKSAAASASIEGAKTAQSMVTPLAVQKKQSLILVEIKTGRTHQIRAQAAARGMPLSGDKKYGGRPTGKNQSGFFLHALSLEFAAADGKTFTVKAPLPDKFRRIIHSVFGADVLQALQ